MPHAVAAANTGDVPGGKGTGDLQQLRADFVLYQRYGFGGGGVTKLLSTSLTRPMILPHGLKIGGLEMAGLSDSIAFQFRGPKRAEVVVEKMRPNQSRRKRSTRSLYGCLRGTIKQDKGKAPVKWRAQHRYASHRH